MRVLLLLVLFGLVGCSFPVEEVTNEYTSIKDGSFTYLEDTVIYDGLSSEVTWKDIDISSIIGKRKRFVGIRLYNDGNALQIEHRWKGKGDKAVSTEASIGTSLVNGWSYAYVMSSEEGIIQFITNRVNYDVIIELVLY
jgi:hypothetical protein